MFTGLGIDYDKLISKTKPHKKLRRYYLFQYYFIKFIHSIILTIYLKRKIGTLGEQFCDSIEWRGTRRADYSYNKLIELFK